jgi:urea transport system permease protein
MVGSTRKIHCLWLHCLSAALIALFLSGLALADITASAKGLSSSNTDEVRSAIAALGNSGDERALPILKAFEEQELATDAEGRLCITQNDKVLDALTGAPTTPVGALTSVQVSNVIRRVLTPTLAQLRLTSRDLNERRAAASEIAKRPSEDTLSAVQTALSKEQDSEVREDLNLAVAQLDLQSDDSARKIAALKVVEQYGEVSLRNAVQALSVSDASNPQVKAQARATLRSLERRILVFNWLANSIYGLSLGSVLLLAAMGLAITFGLMRVINMAHGEMLMLGAYTTFVMQNVFAKYLPSQQDYYLIAAIPVAFAFTGLVGVALERGVIRFLYGRPLETLLATWGISLMLIQTVRLVFGAQNVAVANPSWLSGGWELLPAVVLPYSRIATIIFVCIVVLFVWLLLQRTRLGLYVRAVTQNREMAASLGVPTHRIDMWTFAFGSGVAGLGGVAISQLGNVGPELGQGYIVDSFMVVVLGGVGKLAGTVVGALGLGVINKYLEPFAGAVLGKIFVLVFIILFIQKRPQGLFALKGRAAEL